MTDASRGGIRKLIAAGHCVVDGESRTAGFRLVEGQRLEVGEAEVPSIAPEEMEIRVLYEDDVLIAIDKPYGILTHPTSRERHGTIANGLRFYFLHRGQPAVRPHFLHRLDRETSGVLLVAKHLPKGGPAAHLFAGRQVAKLYQAVVSGEPEWERRSVDQAIYRHSDRRPQWQADDGGLPSETLLQRLDGAGGRTRLLASPVTGRTNQIRIHCSVIGHPIVGDTSYGGPPADRMYLHAWRLGIPVGGQMIWIESVLPASFVNYGT